MKNENVKRQLEYVIEDRYETDNLFVGTISNISSKYLISKPNDFAKVETTKQKYVFLKRNENEYQEIFTGIILLNKASNYDRPYITNIEKLNNYYKNKYITKIDLLLFVDKLNNKKDLDKPKDKFSYYDEVTKKSINK